MTHGQHHSAFPRRPASPRGDGEPSQHMRCSGSAPASPGHGDITPGHAGAAIHPPKPTAALSQGHSHPSGPPQALDGVTTGHLWVLRVPPRHRTSSGHVEVSLSGFATPQPVLGNKARGSCARANKHIETVCGFRVGRILPLPPPRRCPPGLSSPRAEPSAQSPSHPRADAGATGRCKKGNAN